MITCGRETLSRNGYSSQTFVELMCVYIPVHICCNYSTRKGSGMEIKSFVIDFDVVPKSLVVMCQLHVYPG